MKLTIAKLKKIIKENYERTPVEVTGLIYHVTTTKNARSMLYNGIKPQSKGSLNESNADKTYFFTQLEAAVSLHDAKIGDENDPMGVTNDGQCSYSSYDAFDYIFIILQINTNLIKDAKWFKDHEFDGLENNSYAVFTQNYVPPEAIRIVQPKTWLKILKTKIWPAFGWNQDMINNIKMPEDVD
jgi:hypothetical protein